ncbi:MAG: carbon-nitrogen family hydrolase [Bacillota bacterium]|jgi:omega-amidase
MQVSLVQMDIVLGDPGANRQKIRELTAPLGRRDVILLPELWSTGYQLDQAGQLAEDSQGESVVLMQQVARAHQAYVGGSILGRKDGRVYNQFILVTPQGETLATYEKLHLFGLMEEDLYLAPGDRPMTAPVGGVTAGLAICYDLRFPELFRYHMRAGAELLLLSSEWPNPRLEHWRTLLRARAIENQFFVLACNRVGQDNNNTFFGHSMVIDPWGEILLEGDDREQVLDCEIDLSTVASTRERLPALRDRREI